MSDPIPGNDPNAAYDVVPSQDWLHGWWTVTCNGIPVWHCSTREKAERYATDNAGSAIIGLAIFIFWWMK
jgi:hypothetical protein